MGIHTIYRNETAFFVTTEAEQRACAKQGCAVWCKSVFGARPVKQGVWVNLPFRVALSLTGGGYVVTQKFRMVGDPSKIPVAFEVHNPEV